MLPKKKTPLLRADLLALVAEGRRHDLYINLITSGVGLSEKKADELISGGVEHFQLSFQDSELRGAEEISGTKAHPLKLKAAALLGERASAGKAAFTINLVVHRRNLARLEPMPTQRGPIQISPTRHEPPISWSVRFIYETTLA